MKREPHVRDRLIHAAMRYAHHEGAIRSLTLRMKASECQAPERDVPCYGRDDSQAWRRPEVEIPDWYCDGCVQGTILARERHALKARRPLVKGGLLRAAGAFKGSIYGACAGPWRGEAEAEPSTGPLTSELPPWTNSPSSSVTL